MILFVLKSFEFNFYNDSRALSTGMNQNINGNVASITSNIKPGAGIGTAIGAIIITAVIYGSAGPAALPLLAF